MSKIHILDKQTANSIAAGEVVERPASVVKELVENALDASASIITIEIEQGGIRLIRITDNGSGMPPEDALLAFSRHATSKLQQIEDLDEIATMGFRGEALASIAAVSEVRLKTRELDEEQGFYLRIEAGTVVEKAETGCPAGTTISVEHLFANVPARFKFLRKDTTEAGVITDVAMRLSLARPDVSFRLVSNGQEVFHTPGNNDLLSTLYAVYGKKTAGACLEVDLRDESIRILGFAGRPELARSNRNQQSFFVNGRLVKSRLVSAALDEAYKTLLMKGKFAFAVIFVEVPSHLVDVNVHPQKLEVRFWNDQAVFRAIFHAVRQALTDGAEVLRTSDEDDDPVTAQPDPQISGRPISDSDYKPAEAKQNLTLADNLQQQQILNLEPVQQADPAINREAAAAEREEMQRTDSDKSPKINILSQARLIGQVFSTYLLLEHDQDLLLIDQHAAHEKIIFEELVRNRQSHNADMIREELLVPLQIEVSSREMQFLEAEEALLQDLGFSYDRLGGREIILRSQPATSFSHLEPEKAFKAALDGLMREDTLNEETISEALYTIACKAAVKAHDRLQDEETAKLLQELQKLENPYQCPHGRPVIIRISRRELEKKFKRIV